ncbi:MAG: Flp pilus assembly complex ATPase component TadA [Candidatus Omnitrophica bacterium]|nr:Flp pilus assembly complex ATPase component TadA [Candidatus Omnitrophota bacterium]
MAISIKERLTKILIEGGLLTDEKLEEALRLQKEKGGRLSQILVEGGYVGEKDLLAALSQGLNIPAVNLAKLRVDPSIVKMVPKELAKHYNIIPISRIGNTLTVAMADPLNIFAMDDVKAITGMEIGPIIATQKDITQAIDQYYGQSAYSTLESIIKDIKETKLELVEEEKEEGLDSTQLMRLTQETPVVRITNIFLSQAVQRRASDLLIEPLESKLRVRYRIDGVLQEFEAPPKSMHSAIISRLKVMAQLDIAQRRLPQDGRFKIRLGEREVDFRISILPSSFGEKAALRILDKSQLTLDMEKLGFEPKALEDIERCASKPHGMLLICGPTGSGKTTTLYSILKFVDSPEENIVTVEDPVEYQLEGINQVTVHPDIGLTFAGALRSILRQDPNVIMIGEIRDFDTVDIAIKSALTGHLVLSTLHTTDAAGSIIRLVNMGVEPFLITSSVIMVAAQRLIRKICTRCKEAYAVHEGLKKELTPAVGVENKEIILYRGKGCPECLNTGYAGRVGLIEVLVLTPEIKDLIMQKAPEARIKEAARKNGMATLRENGIQKALAGITTIDEILRVTAQDQPI